MRNLIKILLRVFWLLLLATGTSTIKADDDVFVQVLPGHDFNAARNELNQAGWKISQFVSGGNYFRITNPNWSFIYNGVVTHIRDLNDDPGHTVAEYEALLASLSSSFSTLAHSELIMPDGFHTQNAFYSPRPTYTSYDYSPAACQAPGNNGTAAASTKHVGVIDTHPIWQSFNNLILDGHIKNGLTAEADQWQWEKLNVPSNSILNHASSVAEIALQSAGMIIHPYSVAEIKESIPDMVKNGVKAVVMPLSHPSSPIGNGPSIQKRIHDELEAMHDAGILPIKSAGNTEATTEYTENQKARHNSNKVLVIATHDGSGAHVGPCSDANDKTIDISIRSDNMTVNGSLFANASTSFAVARGLGIVGDIMTKYPAVNTPEKAMAVMVNSTRIANNRVTKDVCEGWGKLDACKAYDYAANNYPTRSWSPNWSPTGWDGVDISSTPELLPAFTEACIKTGNYVLQHPDFSNLRKCSTSQTVYSPIPLVNGWIDTNYPYQTLGDSPVRYSAYENCIPTFPPISP
jgi:hypothetical protein